MLALTTSRTLRTLIFGLIAVTSLAAERASADSQKTFSGPNGQIVFSSSRSGSGYTNLYVANADGTGATRVTYASVHDRSPGFAPDGRQIAFLRQEVGTGENLFVVRSDGSGLTQLTTRAPCNDTEPCTTTGARRYEWSPDGTRIAYDDDVGNVFIVSVDGLVRQRLAAPSPGIWHSDPRWSPDGTRIAYATGWYASGAWGTSAIMLVSANGTNPTVLVAGPDGTFKHSARWSPDGSRIAYATDVITNGTILTSLAIIGVNGTGQTVLTTGANVDEQIVAWSATADRILFSYDDGGMGRSFFTVRPDGSDRIKAFDGSPYTSNPVFSPDGTRILYNTESRGFESIDLRGGSPRLVTQQGDYDAHWGTNTTPTRRMDHVTLELRGAKRISLDSWLESGDFTLSPSQISGYGTMRTADGKVAEVTFALTRRLSPSTFMFKWSGTIRIVANGIDVTVDMANASITGSAGTGSKSWTTWQVICGFVSCFSVPVGNSITFAIDNRL